MEPMGIEMTCAGTFSISTIYGVGKVAQNNGLQYMNIKKKMHTWGREYHQISPKHQYL